MVTSNTQSYFEPRDYRPDFACKSGLDPNNCCVSDCNYLIKRGS